MQDSYENTSESKKMNDEKADDQNSLTDMVKPKSMDAWEKLSTYGKITTITITVFAVLCIIAFLLGKTFAAIIAILQIVLTVIALLMKKQIFKNSKKLTVYFNATFFCCFLIPYIYLFKSNYESIKRFKWSDIVLSDIVPETKSKSGEILISVC